MDRGCGTAAVMQGKPAVALSFQVKRNIDDDALVALVAAAVEQGGF